MFLFYFLLVFLNASPWHCPLLVHRPLIACCFHTHTNLLYFKSVKEVIFWAGRCQAQTVSYVWGWKQLSCRTQVKCVPLFTSWWLSGTSPWQQVASRIESPVFYIEGRLCKLEGFFQRKVARCCIIPTQCYSYLLLKNRREPPAAQPAFLGEGE